MIKSNVVCAICKHEANDLRYHIERCHNLTSEKYKALYNSPVVSDSVLKKRRETSLERYGEEHFTNRPAASLSFQEYEGGHPLKDSGIKAQIRVTKEKLYGDPTYTNREKAKRTSLERYGTEYTCAAPEVIKKRIETLKSRYGRVFNVDRPHNKTDAPTDFVESYMKGTPMDKLSLMYGVSEPVISRWVKESDLKRSYVEKSDRIIETPHKIVSEYFQECLTQNKALSFYEYGKIRGANYTLKMKRLFNAGKRYYSLKEELFKVTLDVDAQNAFISKLS
jgi:hypothetical protein